MVLAGDVIDSIKFLFAIKATMVDVAILKSLKGLECPKSFIV